MALNESAVQVLSDAVLSTIARELTDAIRKNVTIDTVLQQAELLAAEWAG